jgi:hypothetical protein
MQISLIVVVLVAAALLNASANQSSKKVCRSHNANTFIGNVVLHASFLVDSQLSLFIDGASESSIIVASVYAFAVSLGIINVLLGSVASEPLGCNFEFARTVTEGHEAENTKQKTDGLGGNSLDRSDIDGLRVVAAPVAQVGLLDHELAELLASVVGVGSGKAEQDILDITMSP